MVGSTIKPFSGRFFFDELILSIFFFFFWIRYLCLSVPFTPPLQPLLLPRAFFSTCFLFKLYTAAFDRKTFSCHEGSKLETSLVIGSDGVPFCKLIDQMSVLARRLYREVSFFFFIFFFI